MDNDAPITHDSLDDKPAPSGFDPVLDAREAERRIAAAALEASAAKRDAEVADRRAAQSAREAREAHEEASAALTRANRSALVAAVATLVAFAALVSAWRPDRSREVEDLRVYGKLIVGDGRDGGPRIVMKTENGSSYVGLYPGATDEHGVFIAAGMSEGIVRVVGPSTTRYAQLSVDNTPDLHELPRVLLVHDDKRNAMSAHYMPRYEGR